MLFCIKIYILQYIIVITTYTTNTMCDVAAIMVKCELQDLINFIELKNISL